MISVGGMLVSGTDVHVDAQGAIKEGEDGGEY